MFSPSQITVNLLVYKISNVYFAAFKFETATIHVIINNSQNTNILEGEMLLAFIPIYKNI